MLRLLAQLNFTVKINRAPTAGDVVWIWAAGVAFVAMASKLLRNNDARLALKLQRIPDRNKPEERKTGKGSKCQQTATGRIERKSEDSGEESEVSDCPEAEEEEECKIPERGKKTMNPLKRKKEKADKISTRCLYYHDLAQNHGPFLWKHRVRARWIFERDASF